MSHGERPTVPGLDAEAFVLLAGMRVEANTTADSEETPPSGVILRREVLRKIPRLAVSMNELRALPLDHRAGFIVSFIDGTYSIEMILDVCAMRRQDALAILGELAARGVIVVD
jgi:hypothetical protein